MARTPLRIFATAATLLTLASKALAQSASTTTITLPFWGYDDPNSLQVSVMGITSGLTTMSITCAPAETECGLAVQQTLTIGPSTYNMHYADPGDQFTATQDCRTTGPATEGAVCTASYGGAGANDPGITTTTFGDGDVVPVTVTAGAELLLAGAGPTTTTAPASSQGTSSSGTGTAAAATTTPTGSAASSSHTSATASPTGTGGAGVLRVGSWSGWLTAAILVVSAHLSF